MVYFFGDVVVKYKSINVLIDVPLLIVLLLLFNKFSLLSFIGAGTSLKFNFMVSLFIFLTFIINVTLIFD